MTDVLYRRGAGRGVLQRTGTVTAAAVSFLLLACQIGAEQTQCHVPWKHSWEYPFQVVSWEHTFQVVPVVTRLVHPWAVAFLPGGDMLVTERPGRLLRVGADGRVRPISGLPPIVAVENGGLLDLVLDPGFADNRLLYFSYTERSRLPWWRGGGDGYRTAVARAELAGDRLVSMRRIFVMDSFSRDTQRFGSRLAFLPDGDLVVTVGDRGQRRRAQDPSDHAGSVLRIRSDGSPSPRTAALAIPGAAPEVFTFGHRNPQGLAVHPASGAIWIHEHGPRGGDEINILRGGANYGWPVVTYGRGFAWNNIGVGHEAPGMEPPLLHWTPSIAPSGMAFYTGSKFPRWRDNLFVGALRGRHLRRIVVRDGVVASQEVLLKDCLGRIRDVRQGPDGRLWLLTDERRGALYRIEPVEP